MFYNISLNMKKLEGAGDTGLAWVRVISGFVMFFVFVISLSLNSLLLHVLRSKKLFFSKGNRFVGFLLINELCVRVFGSPLVVLSVFAGKWLFGDIGCLYYAFLMTFLGINSISLLTVIAIERFLVIVPKHRHVISKRSAVVLTLCCAGHGLGWAIAPLCGFSEYVYEPSGMSCTPSWAPQHYIFVISMMSASFVVPFMFMVIAYGTIMWKVRVNMASQQVSRISEKELSKTMVLIMASFLFCWLPYAIIAGLGTLSIDTSVIAPELTLIPLACAKSAGLWHPVIYGLKNSLIRKEIYKTFRNMLFRKNRVEFERDPGARRLASERNLDFLGINNSTTPPVYEMNQRNENGNSNTNLTTTRTANIMSSYQKTTSDRNCTIFSLDAGMDTLHPNTGATGVASTGHSRLVFQPRSATIDTEHNTILFEAYKDTHSV